MSKLELISYYSRLGDYPTKYSLSSMRLAAYLSGQPQLSDLEIKITPVNLEEPGSIIAQKLAKNRADIVGLPAYMWTSQKSREVAEALAEISPDILTVLGGPDTATFDYSNWATYSLFVLGEGEIPLQWIQEKKLRALFLKEQNQMNCIRLYFHIEKKELMRYPSLKKNYLQEFLCSLKDSWVY